VDAQLIPGPTEAFGIDIVPEDVVELAYERSSIVLESELEPVFCE
jgi:hypothetical protein